MVRKKIQFLPLLLLSLLTCTQAKGQANCFTYGDASKTIITGLTELGEAATDLTIPAIVTEVVDYALADRSPNLSTLVIDGGDPAFDLNVWGGNLPTNLSLIKMGSGMTTTNIKNLLLSLQTRNELATVDIEGYTDASTPINWTNTEMKNVLTPGVTVRMPAALVADQVFADAEVLGRFDLKEGQELATFCGTATFWDENEGGNFLFYVPTELLKETGQIYIQRVRFVVGNQGVMMHNVLGTAQSVWLPRYDGSISAVELAIFSDNMLKGVTTATTIGATDGEYTNFVLSNGAFHPTSGGTLGANRAYLQLATSDWNDIKGSTSRLSLFFEDEETGLNEELKIKNEESFDGKWYTLDGCKLNNQPTIPGIYIHNGRKVMVK